jgi:hypothetical protein
MEPFLAAGELQCCHTCTTSPGRCWLQRCPEPSTSPTSSPAPQLALTKFLDKQYVLWHQVGAKGLERHHTSPAPGRKCRQNRNKTMASCRTCTTSPGRCWLQRCPAPSTSPTSRPAPQLAFRKSRDTYLVFRSDLQRLLWLCSHRLQLLSPQPVLLQA